MINVSNSVYSLNKLGYDNRYFMLEDGTIYDSTTQKIKHPDKNHKYSLLRSDGQWQQVSLRTLYRQVFNKEYYIDDIINLYGEVWKPVILDRNDINVSGYYVSNLGRIKSYKGYVACILKQYTNKQGYYCVKIDGKNLRVHRLVAYAFIPNDNKTEKNTVDHKDGDKSNNKATNLQWMSLIDNIRKGGASNEQ